MTRLGTITGLTLLVAGCEAEQLPDQRAVTARLGDQLPNQTTRLSAGVPPRLPEVTNPFEGNVHAVTEGERLYAWFNCSGCHGAIGGGSIGPPLRDADWIYGGDPGQVYHSIVEGRPNGMPAFRGLPEDSLWKLIAFVRALGEQGAEEPGAVGSDPEKMQREGQQEASPHGAQ